MGRVAVFAGLVLDEADNVLNVAQVGDDAYYVFNDAGFLRHIPSDVVDRQVLATMKEQVLTQRELVVDGTLQFLGQDDLFTKAMVETSIDKMDENMEQLLQTGLPEEARSWLGLMGFHVVVNFRGEVIDLNLPSSAAPDEE